MVMSRLSTTKMLIKITVNIKPEKLAEVTPRQRQLWKHFWGHLISQVQDAGSNRE